VKIDLHTHSNHSDGSLNPTELIAAAAHAGIEVLALTDHDSVAGVEEATRSAAAHSVQAPQSLKIVPGVEISAAWRSQGIHVLGLWVDPASAELNAQLNSQAHRRHIRMRNLCARLTEMGLPGATLLATVEGHPGLPTRAHLAAAMVAAGHVNDNEEAFVKYLGRGKAAALANQWPMLAEVVGWITGAGGVASLAHPLRYKLSAGARRQLITDFKTAGGTGLEVVTGGHAAAQIDTCAQLAMQFGLAGSVGSDFHHPHVSWNPLGRLAKLPVGVTPLWQKFL